MRTVVPIGTTLYQPGRCCNGYTLLFRDLHVTLVDMNGRTINYDHCPQAAALGCPQEVPVTPPKELRIAPDAPLA